MINLQKIDEHLKKYEQDILEDIISLVKIKSVQEDPLKDMPFGYGPTSCLEEALAISRRLGFKTVNLDNKVGYAEVGEGEEIIGIMGHLDVVPEGQDWNTPPYTPTIIDGRMYGRGVSDNKSPVVCAMYALKTLVDFKVPMHKRIRLIYGINEESGFECITHYLKKEGPVTVGFTPDGSFPGIHGEKGIFQSKIVCKAIQQSGPHKLLSLEGGLAYNSAADRAKASLQSSQVETLYQQMKKKLQDYKLQYSIRIIDATLYVEVQGISSHASAPESGLNAVSHLLVILKECGVENSFVDDFNRYFGLGYHGELLGIDCQDAYGRLTLNVGICQINTSSAFFTIDIRYPISKQYLTILNTINQTLKGSTLHLELHSHKEPIYYELSHPLVQTLLKCYQEVTNDYVNQPFTIGGGTYARAMPNIIAFGGGFPGVSSNAHTANENVKIDNIFLQPRVYALAIMKLLEMKNE